MALKPPRLFKSDTQPLKEPVAMVLTKAFFVLCFCLGISVGMQLAEENLLEQGRTKSSVLFPERSSAGPQINPSKENPLIPRTSPSNLEDMEEEDATKVEMCRTVECPGPVSLLRSTAFMCAQATRYFCLVTPLAACSCCGCCGLINCDTIVPKIPTFDSKPRGSPQQDGIMWQRLAERSQDKAILERANAYPSPESSDGSLSPWSQVMDRGGDGSPGHFDTDGMSELSEPDDWSDIEDDRASEEARRRRAALVMEEQVLRAAEEQEQWETLRSHSEHEGIKQRANSYPRNSDGSQSPHTATATSGADATAADLMVPEGEGVEMQSFGAWSHEYSGSGPRRRHSQSVSYVDPQ